MFGVALDLSSVSVGHLEFLLFSNGNIYIEEEDVMLGIPPSCVFYAIVKNLAKKNKLNYSINFNIWSSHSPEA